MIKLLLELVPNVPIVPDVPMVWYAIPWSTVVASSIVTEL
jgi:hypothetical protein